MGAIERTIFESDGSAAVLLPEELGLAIGSAVLFERVGNKIELTLKDDPPVDEKQKLAEFIAALREIWADAPPHPDRGRRDIIEAPERIG